MCDGTHPLAKQSSFAGEGVQRPSPAKRGRVAEGVYRQGTPRMTSLALQIADRIHRLRYEDLTPIALDWTRAAFIDTVGVTLAGIVEDGPRILMEVPGIATAPGPSLIFASDRRTSALDAALVNGTASHALDYDDVSGTLGGHPSVTLIPAMLALGEQLGCTGRELALAYVVGFETECRIARGVHFHHYDKGWHPTATLGIFGTVAAAARLLRFTPDQTAMALGVGRLAGIRAQGEFRHHDQAAACRSYRA